MEVGLFFFNVENGGHQIMRAKKNVFRSQLFKVVGITFPNLLHTCPWGSYDYLWYLCNCQVMKKEIL